MGALLGWAEWGRFGVRCSPQTVAPVPRVPHPQGAALGGWGGLWVPPLLSPPRPAVPAGGWQPGSGFCGVSPRGGRGAPRAFPAFVSPDNGSATCAGGGPNTPPPPPPPRPPHPSAGTDGHRRTDGQRDGHGAPRWWVLKEGDDAGRGGAAVRRQRPGPAHHRHRHRLLAAAPGTRRHRGHRAVAPLPGGALPAPPRPPGFLGCHAGADAAGGAGRCRRFRPGALGRCRRGCPQGASPSCWGHPAAGRCPGAAGAGGVHGRGSQPAGLSPRCLAPLLVLPPRLGRRRPHRLGRSLPPLRCCQGPVPGELRIWGALRGSRDPAPPPPRAGSGWGAPGCQVPAG